jgi:hypothetical protein
MDTEEYKEVEAIIDRMTNTKAMRHLRDEIEKRIKDFLYDEDFTEVFKKELGISHELSKEQIEEIVDQLLLYI